ATPRVSYSVVIHHSSDFAGTAWRKVVGANGAVITVERTMIYAELGGRSVDVNGPGCTIICSTARAALKFKPADANQVSASVADLKRRSGAAIICNGSRAAGTSGIIRRCATKQSYCFAEGYRRGI